MRLHHFVHSLLILTAFLAAARAQDGPKEAPKEPAGIAWAKSWKDAVAAAKADNKPIMIHFSHDSEAVCLEIAKEHFKSEKVIELSRKFVCVLGSVSGHGGEETVVDDGDPKSCPRYGCCSCAEHRKAEIAARTEVLESDSATAPQFVFVRPNLELLVRRPFMLPEGELIDLMNRALYYHDPSATPAEMREQRKEEMDKLLEEAASDNANVRKTAIDTLAHRDDPEIMEFLLAQTSADVDEIKRNEAIRAISEARNPNCIGRLCELMRDRSASIRMNTTLALRNLGMAEAVPALLKAYGTESSSRGKAMILRAAVSCSSDKDVRKLLMKALGSSKSLVRTHAVRACLDMPADARSLGKLVGLARGDTDKTVRAVACHAATKLALEAQQSKPDNADEIASVVKRKLRKALKSVSLKDRDDVLRAYAALCLAALDGASEDYDDKLSDFHKDTELLGSSSN